MPFTRFTISLSVPQHNTLKEVAKEKEVSTDLKYFSNLEKQLQTRDDQSQQLHAMSEKRHESELSEIKGRSFLQRLKAVLIANP